MAISNVEGVADHKQRTETADVRALWHDLDDPAGLEQLARAAADSNTRNFIVEFDQKHASVCYDLTATSVAWLLDVERPEALPTRWINVWTPQHQTHLLELLAKHYDFSPRLLALMASDPIQSRRYNTSQSSPLAETSRKSWRSRMRTPSSDNSAKEGLDELSEHSSVSSRDSATGGNLYALIDDVWHYSSIDFGRNYMSLGYNSLYGTKHVGDPDTVPDGTLPYCTRVWTWLIYCDDNTIISIHEDPFPLSNSRLDVRQQRILKEIRRNLVNVFRSLSTAGEQDLLAYNPMTLLPIRTRIGATLEESAHRASDAPGLLFYYLFENWRNSYTLVTRKESRYGIELNKLKNEMFHAPQLCHIDRLDSLGRELGVLQRHYKSYERIIDRLLEPQVATLASLGNSRIVSSDTSQTSLDTMRPVVTEKESLLGVSLTSATRARFKRLKDLIDLYALSEVEEYIKQKEGLVSMNFSLIALRESADMERLTRVTLLLTKATILFLPVSFMSGYFSINLENVQYTVREYWIGFAVIFALSWAALFVFGVISGSVQTVTFFQGLWRMMRVFGRWFGLVVRRGRGRRHGRELGDGHLQTVP